VSASRRARVSVLVASVAAAIGAGALTGRARAAEPPPLQLVHPIYAQVPDAPERDVTRRAFAAAAERYRLGPVEVVDIPAPAAPRAAPLIKSGAAKALKVSFDDALKDLDAAAAEVAETGGAGLTTTELFDLYLYRAMATARADWRAPAEAPQLPASADDPRGRAFDDYLRAATITTDRPLNPRELPPQVMADFARAAAEVRGRPRGTIEVRGHADAQVALDGAAPTPIAGGASFRDVPYGPHLVHVDEIGRKPWGAAITLAAPALDVDVPETAALVLDDATAAAHARRMGAVFALVAQTKPGPGARMELRLVDIAGLFHDSVNVAAVGEVGQVDAGVMRLDEQARRIQEMGLAPGGVPSVAPAPPPEPAPGPPVLLAPPPAKARFADDPAAWARDHWPLLTAAGVLLTAALILGISVASDR
jgi:hypothetical protein